MSARRLSFASAAAALCAACSSPVVNIGVALSTRVPSDCEGPGAQQSPSSSPVAGVSMLKLSVRGDGISTLTASMAFAQGQPGALQLPDVPLGANRRVKVEGLTAGGTVVSRADSGPFDLLDGNDVTLSLQLRRIDSFTFAGDGTGACSLLQSPRADLAVTMLPDGRVLVSGGCGVVDGATGLCSSGLPSALEVYDPAKGTVTQLPPAASLLHARARHAAYTNPAPLGVNDRLAVVFAGGESGGGNMESSIELVQGASAETLQSKILTNANATKAFTHFAFAVDTTASGNGVFIGGRTSAGDFGSGLQSIFFIDPTVFTAPDTWAPQSAGIPLPQRLSDAVAIGSAKGKGVVAIGGADGIGSATSTVLLFAYDALATTKYTQTRLKPLPAAVLRPAAARIATAQLTDSVLVVGGLTMPGAGQNDYSRVTDAVTFVTIDSNAVQTASSMLGADAARADGCAVQLEDGTRLLYAGGASGAGTGAQSLSRADVLTAQAIDAPTNTAGGLLVPRHRAACTLLRDGTVLVVGGLSFQHSATSTLRSLEVFTPRTASF
jgi:hypothetical protein